VQKVHLKVTVIIPTKNRPSSLRRAIASVANQKTLPSELIIIDQSHDKTKNSLIKNQKKSSHSLTIKYIYKPKISGLTAARNLGIKKSCGDIIQFLDDDSEMTRAYVERLKEQFSSHDVHGCAGKIMETKKRSHKLSKYFQKIFFVGDFRQKREEWYNNKNAPEMYTNSLPGVAAYRKSVFTEFKFDEQMTGACVGEDLEFSMRAAKKFNFKLTPKLKIHHCPDSNERLDQENQAFQKIRFYRYHYKKNIKKSIVNKLLFYWLNFGFLFHYIVDLSPKKVKGFWLAWRTNSY